MQHQPSSIRPFIGAKDFNLSRQFYQHLGFEETILSPDMSVFKVGALAFYLQDAYIKDWVNNTMIFLEVPDVEAYWTWLQSLDLPAKYPQVRVVPVQYNDWGKECFLHDPSNILWHFGQFAR